MLKKMFTKKLTLILAISFSLFLLTLIPNQEVSFKQEVTYNDDIEKAVVYLLDKNNYVARTTVALKEATISNKAKKLLEVLIQDGIGESKIPSGFRSIIPSDTKIKSLKYEDGLIKVDFSKELLDVRSENEEKMISAIIYTLTSIESVKKVIIYVEGDILTYLPKSKIHLPSTLDKSYGINKEYDIETYQDINKVTTYFVSKYNDEYYYVPVTKYTNDKREKIKIIVDELASSNYSSTSLMSFLNSNAVLLSEELEDDKLSLVFNQYIFSDNITENILEEVIYTINLSIEANYDVKEVSYIVNDKEIYKSTIKTLENS